MLVMAVMAVPVVTAVWGALAPVAETVKRPTHVGQLGQVAIGLTAHVSGGRGLDTAALCVLAGSIVFSGTVAAIALGGPKWLGAITPIGGLSMIIGFVLFALAALKL